MSGFSSLFISVFRSAGNSSCNPLILLVLSMGKFGCRRPKIDELPCFFPVKQGIGVQETLEARPATARAEIRRTGIGETPPTR
jgi:hypothetical protein